MNDSRGIVPIGDLAGSVTINQPLVSVDVTPHEARVLAAHQHESALKGIHEAGHTVIGAMLGVRIKTADIGLRHSGETTLGLGDETEVAFSSVSQMDDRIVITLAGLEAERHFLGELMDGGNSDFQYATTLCLDMAAAGMEPDISVSFRAFGGYGSPPHPQWLVDGVAQAADKRMKAARERAAELVDRHADKILAFARLLVAAPERRLSDDDLAQALRAVGIVPPASLQPVGGMRGTRRRRRG
ncbi:MAG: hypothetical protein ABI725_01220 [Chloroflexota bacterium]